MGVCPQQHRISTGKYNCVILKFCVKNKKSANDVLSIGKAIKISISTFALILYMYILLLIMALFIETSFNIKYYSLPTTKYYPNIKLNSYRELINIGFLTVLYYLAKKGILSNFKISIRKHFSCM